MTHVAEGEEYRRRLREEFCEEAGEFRESGDPEELADVLEVLAESNPSASRSASASRKPTSAAASRTA